MWTGGYGTAFGGHMSNVTVSQDNHYRRSSLVTVTTLILILD